MDKEFGKYTLLDHMGKGGVASVYRATDNKGGNIVAIKIFRTDEKRGPDRARKLRDREVRMLIAIQHPNVVKFYESGEIGDDCFYTMEFVENSLLKRMQRPGEFSVADKVHMLRQCANALQAIHHQGIVHRDIKPGNILLDQAPSGAIHVKVTDLGIAKHVSETDIVREETDKRVPGTPKYLSPEQIKLQPVDGRADIFSLGVLAYELCTGKQPFKAETSEEYLKANLKQTPRAMHHVKTDLPEFLSPMVHKMLAKEREERYDSDAVSRDLELAYQHLVSNAPLVEQNNPDSIFYVPPAPEPGKGLVIPRKKVPVRRICVAAFILIGALFAYWKWPEVPQVISDPLTGVPRPAELAPSAALKEADRFAREGQRWKALAMLRGIEPSNLSPEEGQEWQRQCQRLHTFLAESSAAEGKDALEKGRVTEAEVILERIKFFYPMAEQIAGLADAIKKEREIEGVRQAWQGNISTLRRMLRKGDCKEVIDECEKLLPNVGSDAEKQVALRNLIAESVNEWFASLQKGRPNPKTIEDYWEIEKRYREQPWAAEKVKNHDAELKLLMGHYYSGINFPERAREWYEQAMQAGGAVAEEARRSLQEIFIRGSLEPSEAAVVTEDLKRTGFASKGWWAIVPLDGTQKVVGNALEMTQKGGDKKRENICLTLRPVRAVQGFRMGVKFRLDIKDADKVRNCAAGIRIKDSIGNQVDWYFDGQSYKVFRQYTKGGKTYSAARALAAGAGNEAQTWHELTMRYIFETEKLSLFLDGKDLAEYDMELVKVQLQVFLDVTGDGECKATFQDVYCQKP